mmetsp:Transcript_17645/g.48785  ORF Transcript_17645/g.48785 Transcript_17645/m.48785 type:complete len:344 (-) Transcript_17645:8-1039(-)
MFVHRSRRDLQPVVDRTCSVRIRYWRLPPRRLLAGRRLVPCTEAFQRHSVCHCCERGGCLHRAVLVDIGRVRGLAVALLHHRYALHGRWWGDLVPHGRARAGCPGGWCGDALVVPERGLALLASIWHPAAEGSDAQSHQCLGHFAGLPRQHPMGSDHRVHSRLLGPGPRALHQRCLGRHHDPCPRGLRRHLDGGLRGRAPVWREHQVLGVVRRHLQYPQGGAVLPPLRLEADVRILGARFRELLLLLAHDWRLRCDDGFALHGRDVVECQLARDPRLGHGDVLGAGRLVEGLRHALRRDDREARRGPGGGVPDLAVGLGVHRRGALVRLPHLRQGRGNDAEAP